MLGLQNYVNASGLPPTLLELVKIRASQINACAYCLDMHTQLARANGETEQRLYALNAWRETPFFNDRERAALAWTESLTLLHEGHVPDEAFAEVPPTFHRGRNRKPKPRDRRHQQLESPDGSLPRSPRPLPSGTAPHHRRRARLNRHRAGMRWPAKRRSVEGAVRRDLASARGLKSPPAVGCDAVAS